MACPICERVYCDHTPDERGQSFEEMMADCYNITVEEYKKLQTKGDKKDKKDKKKKKNVG